MWTGILKHIMYILVDFGGMILRDAYETNGSINHVILNIVPVVEIGEKPRIQRLLVECAYFNIEV